MTTNHALESPLDELEALAMTSSAARAVEATKIFGSGDTAVTAIDRVSVEFQRERYTAIMGPSGSGKSTLMHCMAGLDHLTSGQVFIGDQDLGDLKDRELTEVRRDRVGFIFQAFNLVPTLTALENITLPIDIAGRDPTELEYQFNRRHRPTGGTPHKNHSPPGGYASTHWRLRDASPRPTLQLLPLITTKRLDRPE